MRQAPHPGASRATAAGPGGREALSLWRRRHHRKGLLYVLPAVLLFGLMIAYPIARSFYLSFFDYSILEPDSARFVGLENYGRLLLQKENHDPFWRTLYFTAIFVPPFVVLALLVAMMLNGLKRGAVALRTIIFTPVVVSLAVSAVMWTLFYNPSFGLAHKLLTGAVGAANWAAGLLGAGPLGAVPEGGVLGDSRWAMLGIAAMCLWNGIGINIILFLVGLQRIPDELYEAAVVDGAGGWRRFWHITLPQLAPTIYLVVLLSLIGAFKLFGQPFIMTGGGPADSTLTYVMRLYNLAFRYGKFQLGYASALAYALALFIFGVSLLVRKLNRPVE
ncbi:MAG TPA: sugar ABC transporter permease [Planctomycetota bacterium]|nr:sugar ABC transporter permease [Planctomycetota bacterium]